MFSLSFLYNTEYLKKYFSIILLVSLLLSNSPAVAFADAAESVAGGEESVVQTEREEKPVGPAGEEALPPESEGENLASNEEGDEETASDGAKEQASENERENGEKEGVSKTTGETSTTTVLTGNADAFTGITNAANNNFVDVTATSTSTSSDQSSNNEDVDMTPTTATGTEALLDMIEAGQGTTTETSGGVALSYSGENVLNATGTATTTATTGGNTASSTADLLLETGDANAFLNVLDKFNTTEINSQGIISQLSGPGFSGEWNLGLTGSDDVSRKLAELALRNVNHAMNAGEYAVMAQTGGNDVCSTEGEATIFTGDAKAGANIVGFGNNTFIESKYVVLSANVLGDFLGDIVLPGNDFFESGADLFESLVQNISNDADVSVNTANTSETGENQTNTDGEIESGSSLSSSVVSNNINSTGVGGETSVNLVFNILGDREGEIYSLPKGVEFIETETGFILESGPSNETENVASTTETTETVVLENDDTISASSTVFSTSTLVSREDVSVSAKTGENILCGNGSIKTGDAWSGLVVLGLYNATFYGKNLLFGAVNIFGDMIGDIAFGRPDLFVAGSTDLKTTAKGAVPGTIIHYTYNLWNNGDADATNVVFTDTLGNYLMYQSSISGQLSGGAVSWNIGTIPAGGMKQVSYTAKVEESIPYGQTFVTNTSLVTAYEPDADEQNNTGEVSVPLYRPSYGIGGSSESEKEDVEEVEAPDIEFSKINDSDGTAEASSTVAYTIFIKNDGGKAYHSVVHDVIRDEEGNAVFVQDWDLGVIRPDELVTLKYAVFYNAKTDAGTYTNHAVINYFDHKNPSDGEEAITKTAQSAVMIENDRESLEELMSASREAIQEGYRLVGLARLELRDDNQRNVPPSATVEATSSTAGASGEEMTDEDESENVLAAGGFGEGEGTGGNNGALGIASGWVMENKWFALLVPFLILLFLWYWLARRKETETSSV